MHSESKVLDGPAQALELGDALALVPGADEKDDDDQDYHMLKQKSNDPLGAVLDIEPQRFTEAL